jgi:hypothetical protein
MGVWVFSLHSVNRTAITTEEAKRPTGAVWVGLGWRETACFRIALSLVQVTKRLPAKKSSLIVKHKNSLV